MPDSRTRTLKQIVTGYPALESLRVHTDANRDLSVSSTLEGLGHDKLRFLGFNNIGCCVSDLRGFAAPAIEVIEVQHSQLSSYAKGIPADDVLAAAADAETAAAVGFVLHPLHSDPVVSTEKYSSAWLTPKVRGYRLFKREQ